MPPLRLVKHFSGGDLISAGLGFLLDLLPILRVAIGKGEIGQRLPAPAHGGFLIAGPLVHAVLAVLIKALHDKIAG